MICDIVLSQIKGFTPETKPPIIIENDDETKPQTSSNANNRPSTQDQAASHPDTSEPVLKQNSQSEDVAVSTTTYYPCDPSEWKQLREAFPNKETSDIVFPTEGTRTIACQVPPEYLLETVALTVRDVVNNLLKAYDDDSPVLIDLIPNGLQLSVLTKKQHIRFMKDNKKKKENKK